MHGARGGDVLGIHDGHREKMRKRFENGGLEHFADHEVLELLLFYAILRRDTNPIAHALMERYGSLAAVLNAPIEDLKKVDGIGENAAVLLRLVGQVEPKARLAEAEVSLPMTSAEAAGKYLLDRFYGIRNEVAFQLCIDRKGKLLICKRLTEGSESYVEMDVRRIVENALLSSASGVILAHNHPSGIALPSADDISATKRVQEALKTIGVRLIDHIIVADGDFVSLAQSGYLE